MLKKFLSALPYVMIAALALLVTFFGIGPVLMADGSIQERLWTLGIVLVIYIVLGLFLRFWMKKTRNRRQGHQTLPQEKS